MDDEDLPVHHRCKFFFGLVLVVVVTIKKGEEGGGPPVATWLLKVELEELGLYRAGRIPVDSLENKHGHSL